MNSLAHSINSIEEIDYRIFEFSNLTFDPSLHLLSTHQENIFLRHKMNFVLLLLAKNIDKAVSRNELINTVWGGNIYTGQQALTHTICKLRNTINILSKDSISIITIPKFGYSLSLK